MSSRFSQGSVDIINTAYMEIAKYKFEVCIPPQKIIKADYVLNSLSWSLISYGNDDELVKIPNDKRGIYAFVIYWPTTILPHHGYVFAIYAR